MLVMGRETLRAYARCGQDKVPDFVLPGSAKEPLPFLSYTNTAYLGRMVELLLADAKAPLFLETCYETDMAEGLKMMALEGRGIAFLPESAVMRDVKYKHLARADGGAPGWEIELEIRLYRERPSSLRPGKQIVESLWQHLVQAQDDKARGGKKRRRAAVTTIPS
jgi:DNA-binding transcriptional LysR family regulator